ncbi:MAG: hypothetical protein ACKOTB_04305, partial [Planctomycetia bacterium]
MPLNPGRSGRWHTVLRIATVCTACAGLIGNDLFATGAGSLAAAERSVLAVVTLDSYGDLRNQLQWLGGQVGQPALAGALESLLLMASQGRGLAGLDVKRPLGVVVTTDGSDLAVHGFVPVKSLDKLLDSLKGVTGPVEKSDGIRTIMLPNGLPLSIAEREGWAIIAPAGSDLDAADPAPLFKHLADDYSLGIQVFPSRMPEPLRLQLRLLLEQAMAAAATQGQGLDPRAVAVALDGLTSTESLSLGLAMDPEASQMFLENRVVAEPGSVGADALRGAAEGRGTVPLPPAADGGRPAVVGHLVQTVPQGAREGVLGMLDQALPPGSDDPLTATIAALAREVIRSVLATGGVDAAVSVDLANAADGTPPAITAGVRVQDGTLLEAAVKKAFAPGGKAAMASVSSSDVPSCSAASVPSRSTRIVCRPAPRSFATSNSISMPRGNSLAALPPGANAFFTAASSNVPSCTRTPAVIAGGVPSAAPARSTEAAASMPPVASTERTTSRTSAAIVAVSGSSVRDGSACSSIPSTPSRAPWGTDCTRCPTIAGRPPSAAGGSGTEPRPSAAPR